MIQNGNYELRFLVGCPRKPNLLIVDLSICGFFEESTDRQIWNLSTCRQFQICQSVNSSKNPQIDRSTINKFGFLGHSIWGHCVTVIAKICTRYTRLIYSWWNITPDGLWLVNRHTRVRYVALLLQHTRTTFSKIEYLEIFLNGKDVSHKVSKLQICFSWCI